ncbi:alpha-D-ribose 1-methylphosphonate 5-triphosphate diphosphatase [Pseudoruegeria sp. SK021]|uniref:alpha-D-ribose 1-methylphosphonate 5-triphosphate diphosphatase n=1 Tax=Pseudoruegeria sp. SK021 TaxID=1933035 RepID=UPI000A239D8B|nr:alpha-D-ribose 1-methylphosphonate 5-triphosphate diphosphatase [Pseudoruegeria sp. SK021]OSP55935.1 alkylphosphonate utilization protein [Pseudoruegeria sp. SK021]
MQRPITSLTVTGAQVLQDRRIRPGMLSIQNGRVASLNASLYGPVLDLPDYWVFPGIIDLHGDAFEHQLAARPNGARPAALGLAAVDRDAARHGITTAWLAQSWSWEGGPRGPEFAEAVLAEHHAYQPRALTDLRVQLRCETYTVDTKARLLAAIRRYGVDYVIFNNHLDAALAMARTTPEQFQAWAARAGRSGDAQLAMLRATKDRACEVPRYLCDLATAFDAMGVRYGSHDDGDGETREYFAMIGAAICEFPTAFAAARVAKASGHPVLMGAPNVLRGGSHSGNVAASLLIMEGLCDALASDGHYPAMARAAFALRDDGLMPLEQAWAMISRVPAAIMGLSDRGTLQPGKRADLVVINGETREIEATMAGGRWSYLSGSMADRLTGGSAAATLAAE